MIDIVALAREARLFWLDYGNGVSVRYRLPLAYETLRHDSVELAVQQAVAWKGVKTTDFLPDEEPDDVKFSTEVFREWYCDRPEFWPVTTNRMTEERKKRDARLESVRGKSPGSSPAPDEASG